MVPENVFCLPTFFGQDWFRRHFAISPFWEKKVFVIQRLIVTKKSEFCSQPHFVVKRKASFLWSFQKKRRSFFFFSNFDFFRKKTCTRPSTRAFFENSFKIRLFTCLQKIRILLGRKKKAGTEKDFARQWSPKKQVANFEVGVVGKTCGETFGLVRFHGAVCGCGCGSRAGKILPAQRGLSFTFLQKSYSKSS